MNYQINRFQSSNAGLAVNAFVVESEKGVVVIDATLLKSDSKALLKKIQQIGKPILGILITHGHPDHIAGLSTLAAQGDPPIFALQSIVNLMTATEEAKHAQWSETFGEEWINKWTYPNHIVKDGESVQLEDLKFTVHDLGAGGDCDANSIWMLEDMTSEAFVGDFIYNNHFSYMNDGKILRWLANLERFTPLLKSAKNLYIGHGNEGGIELIDMQKKYLIDYCAALLEVTNGGVRLSEESTNKFIAEMERKYPAHGLNFMLGLSAAKVASELR